MTGAALWDHADSLARELGTVELFVCDDCDDWEYLLGRAVIEDGKAEIFLSHRPTTPFAYLLYLHELGHLSLQIGARGFRQYGQRPRLRDEACAWIWALKHSAVEPGPDDWFQILDRLNSYGDDRRYKRDPIFDRLLAQAERNAHA